MNDMKFKVDKERGVVVCALYNCRYIAVNRIEKYCNDIIVPVDWMPEEYYIHDTYIGIAKCAPEDEFDEEYGKRLALTRAKVKRNRAINNTIQKYIHKVAINVKRLATYGIHEIREENW